MAIRPTKKQQLLLEFIENFIDEHHYSPSYREIKAGCSYNSVATVAKHVNNLIARGHLVKRPGNARSLDIVKHDQQATSERLDWLKSEIESRLNDKDPAPAVTLIEALAVLGYQQQSQAYRQRLEQKQNIDT